MNKFILTLARWMALLGGAVLLLLVVTTCVSVLGRGLNSLGHWSILKESATFLSRYFQSFGPITGDFEIIETGIAFAILAFFPWCSVTRGHATVDVFTSMVSKSKNRLLTLFWEIVFFAALGLITWRLFIGMSDKMRYGETTFLLQTPVWWGFAACAFAASVATLVAGFSIFWRFKEWRTGKDGEFAVMRADGNV